MSAKGIFVAGFTVADVLAIQDKAKDMLKEGKTVMSWSDNGTSVNKQLAMPVREVLEECSFALRKLDPDTYGGTSRKVIHSHHDGPAYTL